ncbi:RHS repeat domain-containing protein [Escherichia coli]
MVKKEHADGSVTQSQFDAVGRLRAQTDAAGRTTEYSPDVVTVSPVTRTIFTGMTVTAG